MLVWVGGVFRWDCVFLVMGLRGFSWLFLKNY